jgi:hypothetical protein
MTLDLHWIVNGLLGLVLIGVGWFCREIWGATQALRKDLASLERDIGQNYVRYDRLQDALQPIVRTLERIEDTLSKKVDKP